MKRLYTGRFSAPNAAGLPHPASLAGPHQSASLPIRPVSTAAAYQHLQALLVQMPVAMYLLRGPAHVLDLVSEAAATSWGCSPDQVMGKPFFEALPHLRGQGYEAAYATAWQTQQAVLWHEAPIMGSEQPGEPAALGYFNVSFQPYYEGPGCLAGILVTSHDVTEQVLARQQMRQATQELAATNAGLADYVTELTQAAHTAQLHAEAESSLLAQLLEQAPLAIGLLVGGDYVVRLCNPRLLARWQRTPLQVLGQPLFEALPELSRQGLRKLLDQASHPGAPALAHQLPGPGEPLFYHSLRDAQGRTIAIAVIARGSDRGPACPP